ncbi:MAG: xanthine dehydrogenase family protein molybdopterin-binding subunit [Actinomycetota bacterium]
MASKVIGGRFIRADGLPKVSGQARYTADLAVPGMLHARFLYAGHAHARIRSIDTTEARALPGVMAVITQDDLPETRYGTCVKDRTLFARDVVRYEGEIVAAVAALTPELADHACRQITVEYEPLEPVLDPEAALADGAPLVHPNWETAGTAYEGLSRDRNDCGYVNIVKGDMEAGFAEADEIVEERYVADMSHAVPIEPHAILAEWQGERVTVWSSTQVPFIARSGVTETLGVPEGNVRVIVSQLGGGFGGKCDFHFEAHVAALARKAGRPVRLVFTRREEFIVPDKVRHPMIMELRTGVKRDGAITARKARVILDTGAYASDSPILQEVATMMVAGPYRTPNLLIEGHTVYTNKTPGGSVRAPTGPEGCWALESHMDEVAARIGMDPVELRRMNLAAEGDEGPTGQRFEGIGVGECLERAAELIGYRPGRALPEGEGIGFACGWWFSAPSDTGAYVKLNVDGTATVVTGAQENGSGAVMGMALLVGETLGIPPEGVSFVYQDTDAGPWDGGSAGSQTTFNVGRAVLDATGKIRERVLERASELLETATADLELGDGEVRVKGAPDRAVTVAEIASGAMDDGELLLASSAPLPPPMPASFGGSACVGRVVFPAFAAPAFACQAARVKVDRETGVVRVLEVAAAHDFGRVLNPIGAEGQVEGGVAMGVGIALSEGTVYEGAHQRNPDLLDYKLVTAADAPLVKVAFVDAPVREDLGGPFGSKGVGEPPCVPTVGAVANALAAATGVRQHRIPMTPARVWAAMRRER